MPPKARVTNRFPEYFIHRACRLVCVRMRCCGRARWQRSHSAMRRMVQRILRWVRPRRIRRPPGCRRILTRCSSTARAAKQWAPEHWVAVAQALAARNLSVLLPWGNPKEKQAAERLAALMPQATVLPALPLMDAVTLIRRAALVVGLDTGLTHIAAAYCRPTVELYCDSPRWKTEGNWSPFVANLGDTGQAPDVAQVLLAIDGVLSAQAAA